MTDCTIYLDAGFDLYQAGLPNHADARESFAAAYASAAAYLGGKLGVTISIAAPPCSEYGGLPGGNVESEEWARERQVWQGLHDSLSQEGGEWDFSRRSLDAFAADICRAAAV